MSEEALEQDENRDLALQSNAAPQLPKPKQRLPAQRKRNLTLATLFFITVALIFVVMYSVIWQHEELTEDAYVAGYQVQITPQITGTVQQITVDDTDVVKEGDVLVRLDDSDMQLAFERAQNELIQAIRQNQQQTAVNSQAGATVLARKVELAKAQSDLRRRETLAGTDAISGEELSHARAAVVQAQAALKAVEAEQIAVQVTLGKNITLRQQPAIQTAVSHIKDAWLNLQRTRITAPMAGQVAKRNIQVGQRVEAGTPMMAVVPLSDLWVDANFKESQMLNMRIGQPVELISDLYGKQVKYQGKVIGLSAGTGSVFSALPPQNATGNWVKVVQRVAVRISLDSNELLKHPLRVGLSMHVTVDTVNAEGSTIASAGTRPRKSPETESVDWKQADVLIDKIFEKYAK